MTNSYALWSIGIFLPLFGMLYQDKSGSPEVQTFQSVFFIHGTQRGGIQITLIMTENFMLNKR
jgi:hypothetical protein